MTLPLLAETLLLEAGAYLAGLLLAWVLFARKDGFLD